jgi:hypothetical protein
MTKRRKTWVYSPSKGPKPKVPAHVKAELERKANALVEAALKSAHVKPPPEDARFNYIVDIYTKWYRNYFYFCARYHVPGPNAIKPFFEAKFARMEYIGNDRFALSFMRYTEQWVELYTDLSMDECLSAIQDEPFFYP